MKCGKCGIELHYEDKITVCKYCIYEIKTQRDALQARVTELIEQREALLGAQEELRERLRVTYDAWEAKCKECYSLEGTLIKRTGLVRALLEALRKIRSEIGLRDGGARQTLKTIYIIAIEAMAEAEERGGDDG